MPRLRSFKWAEWAERTTAQVLEDRPTIIALDTETEGVGFYDEAFCATLTWRSPAGELRSGYYEFDTGVRAPLQTALRAVPAWVGHNIKFDLQKLMLAGVIEWRDLEGRALEDTQTIFHLLDENGRKGLKHLAATVLKVDDTIEVEIKSGPNKGKTKRVPKEEYRLAAVRRTLKLKKDDGYHLLPREVLIPYALKDTEYTLLLYEALRPQIAGKDPDGSLTALYEREMDLKLVLLRMEGRGMKLEIPYLEEKTSEYGSRVMEGWQRVVELTGNPDLNPQSPKQLLDAFAERGHILESTDVATLGTLDDELAKAILKYRSDKKLHTTYLAGLLREQRDGLVHPNFNPDGARTGRMSSGSAAN